MPNNDFRCLVSLRFFTPIEQDGIPFQVGIYYDEKGEPCVSVHDLLKALGFHQSVFEKKTYEIIDKLDLEVNKDYTIKCSEDVILNKVEHILCFEAAYRAVQLFNNEAATQFFEAVSKFRTSEQVESDVFRLFSYDLIVRSPVFNLDTLAYVFQRSGYNDGEIDTESLIKMLKKDRILTRALRPVKGFEHLFVRFDNSLWMTPHGFSYLTRKYIGLSVHESIGCVATVMPNASRLISDSIFCETRVERMKETEKQESEVKNEGDI